MGRQGVAEETRALIALFVFIAGVKTLAKMKNYEPDYMLPLVNGEENTKLPMH